MFSMLKQTREYTLLVWSLAFFLIENIDSAHMESDFPSNVVQNAIGDLAQSTTVMAHNAILKVTIMITLGTNNLQPKFPGTRTCLDSEKGPVEQVRQSFVEFIIGKIEKSKPQNSYCRFTVAAQLHVYRFVVFHFHWLVHLTVMFLDCAEHLENVSKSSDVVQTNPDHLVQTVEKITAIFERLRKGQVFEVDIVCAVLPNILEDFFSPSDVLTKVIGEFLSPQQPHPKLLSRVLFQVSSFIYRIIH